MPPRDYKACCVFASGLTRQTDTLLTVSPSAHPVHKLSPDLLCPCWVHYCFCVVLRQNMGHVLQLLSCRELSCSEFFFSCMSRLWPCRVFAGRHCKVSVLACILNSEQAAQQPGGKAHLGLGDLAEATG